MIPIGIVHVGAGSATVGPGVCLGCEASAARTGQFARRVEAVATFVDDVATSDPRNRRTAAS